MSLITVQSFSPTIPWRYGATGVTLRVYYSEDFIDSQGNPIQGGNGDTGFYYEFACTVSSSVITVPQFVIISTLDSRSPVVTCSAFLYHQGSRKDAVWTDWAVPSTTPTTIGNLEAINAGNRTLVNPPDSYLTRAATQDLLDEKLSRTEGGGAALSLGAITNGEFLKRSGTSIVSGTATSEAITDVTKAPYSADNTGATDASAAIRSAIAAGAKRIYLPAGTYLISQAQITANSTLFSLSGQELFGDGMGMTFITVPASVTWHGSNTTIIGAAGNNSSVHDISFLGTNTVASGFVTVLAAAQGGIRQHFYNVEMSGWGDANTAGAGLITTHQPHNATDVSTTLGTTIASGSRTVTPASMNGIYTRKRLVIGGTTETVIVTAATATTFTATFANAHDSSDSVTGYYNSVQGALIENFDLHDNPRATGIVVNSNGNVIRDGRIKRVGATTSQHGLYVQGGQNFFDNIWVEGVSGYGIHQYPTHGGVGEASGNTYNDLKIIDAETFHVLISSEFEDTSNGSNIYYPSGTGLSRYTQITNCLFRNTTDKAAAGFDGLSLNGAVIFTGNVLEDITQLIVSKANGRSVFANNIVRRIHATADIEALLPENYGGGTQVVDISPNTRNLKGQNAWPEATGAATAYSNTPNTTYGRGLYLAAGIGSRKFAAVSNTAGSVAVTIAFSGPEDDHFIGSSFTLTSGVDFTLGSDNTAGQLAVTATNLATAINAGSSILTKNAFAYSSGANVFLLPGRTTSTLTISTDQAGRISATSGVDGALFSGHNIKTPSVQWLTGTKPAAAAAYRGMVWYVAGGAGVADTFEVCRKDAADAYAWVSLF